MKIAIIGTGYVGLVSGVCFSGFGHDVVCFDKDADKIDQLERGEGPIYEPGPHERCKSRLLGAVIADDFPSREQSQTSRPNPLKPAARQILAVLRTCGKALRNCWRDSGRPRLGNPARAFFGLVARTGAAGLTDRGFLLNR